MLDSLHCQLMLVYPEKEAYDEFMDFLEDVTIAFSSASNHEKRLAQSKIVIQEEWERYVEVKIIYNSLEKTYRHLMGQFDTLSRLITCHQGLNREVSRGAVSMADGTAIPRTSNVGREDEIHIEDSEFVNSQLSQPLGLNFKGKGLDKLPEKPFVPSGNRGANKQFVIPDINNLCKDF